MNETATANLTDKRLNDRLREVLSRLGEHPTASIPAACGGHARMTGVYRLFDNEKATFSRILQPHVDATRARLTHHAVVVLAEDTTVVDVTRPEQQPGGVGPSEGGPRRGCLLHLLHAFTPDGTPLGTLYGLAWVRAEEIVCASLSRAERAATPIEEKESHRWVETLRYAGEEALRCPATQLICVADSEADIYELLVEGTTGQRREHDG